MPKMDGISLFSELKKNIHTQNIPILFCTARSFSQVKREIINISEDHYIEKPFDFLKLLGKIKKFLLIFFLLFYTLPAFGEIHPEVKKYKILAEKGDSHAQCRLGDYYFIPARSNSKNYTLAFMWYKKAAKQGHKQAQNHLGVMYLCGKGTNKNFKKAVKNFKNSADQGFIIAQCNLGDMYFQGNGVKKNFKKAFYWYEKAAQKGWAIAQWKLGEMFFKGQGVSKNFQKAYYWLTLAQKDLQTTIPAREKVLGEMTQNEINEAREMLKDS
jgi:CheY-like chemotaxis protein